jgi:hypothetical protein
VRKSKIECLLEWRERLLINNGPTSLSAAWALAAIERKLKNLGEFQTPGSPDSEG